MGKQELLAAIERGDHAAIESELDAGAEPNAADRHGTALGHAVARGDLQAVELLLARGADADKTSDQGNAPLMLAAARGDVEIVRRLLDAGADPDKRNKWGFTADDWARWPANAAEVEALLASRRGG